ncbi:MAG: chemotaxis-specific protein-glutamate methyltransferase CheB [Desulfuromonadales bacterium]|nr:chemotaxis-specific protein-glutamate methyltransferase CheB [Desulfuromonadales bacterium]
MHKSKIRVLVVDDNILIRKVIIDILIAEGNVIIAGEASNGREAIEKTAELRPDLITMDIEMPVMGGLEAIERIMMSTPVPILVVSSYMDTETISSVMARGALEVVDKPGISTKNGADLLKKVRLLAGVRVTPHLKREKTPLVAKPAVLHPWIKTAGSPGIVAIAASTGGPPVLADILSQLPGNYALPIVVAQHIANGFAAGMVTWLNSRSSQEIMKPEDGATLLPGRVYIAPPEYNMEINEQKRIVLCERPPNDMYHPSCNALLNSVSRVYGPASVGVILSGMGNDGVNGMRAIKKAGGITIAQDEASCLIFGMPGLAVESGCIDRVLPPAGIAAELIRLARHASNCESVVNGICL